VYLVLGILYENFVHRSRFFPRSLRPASAPLLALLLFHTELSIIALIGIILLIGIVKKNAILMIDFALQAEREQATAPPIRFIRPACCAFGPS